ncbi:hypothetical protein [Candidatus Viridilinea mediisalina]|uniref:Uncharacterized protein n=1 Tax=Candidatus Viridilinea mediisalina TaxID=2024553 RepID=A0A2A6RLM0_9CHLR|nr:hypothetical protein [Candidatus Viridilinea mediisalina]PDW04004.1 hypothetical protein CJ255_05960 [Candidatus Viridilinea mediisalina]
MAKKSSKQNQPNPALRLSTLSPRLKQLTADQALALPSLETELSRLTNGLKPASFLPILVNTLVLLPDQQQERINPSIGQWLQAQGLIDALAQLEANQNFTGTSRNLVRHWLEAAGTTLAPIEEVTPDDLFIAAYTVGNESQSSLALFWYKDERRRQVQSLMFLIDHEPPWEGALKDIAYKPFRNADIAMEEYFKVWEDAPDPPEELDRVDAMQQFWASLRQNQAQGIRLPVDFIAVLPQTLVALYTLSDHPEVSPLSQEELLALAQEGQSPERIRKEEQLHGYQMRRPDGSVMRIMRPPDEPL